MELAPERTDTAPFDRSVRTHLGHILLSPDFDASGRSREFLRFIVEEALAGRRKTLNQTTIATSVFGRKADFDPVLDPIVRIQAGRLRRSLERYYLLAGKEDPVRIEIPKGTYFPVFVAHAAQEQGTAAARIDPMGVPFATEWPAVLVCSFEVTASRDDDAALRVTDEVALELCRYGDVRVIRDDDVDRREAVRPTPARFELRGKLRRDAEGWIVTARLADRTTGEQVWGDEYHTTPRPERWSGSLDDVARIIAACVGSESGIIVRIMSTEYRSRSDAAPGSYAAILRSYGFFSARDIRQVVSTVAALRHAVALEPETAVTWAYLARMYLANHSFELTDLETPIELAIRCAYRGVMLSPASARPRCVLAAALLVKGEIEAARHELEQALRLNAESLAYREIIGWLTALLGDWERGIALMRDAMRRNPYCLAQVNHGLWADHLRRGEFEEAYIGALEYRDPTFFWRELMTACCLGHLGRLTEARASAAELLRLKPDFARRGRTLIGHYIKPVELRERIVEGLGMAGLTLS